LREGAGGDFAAFHSLEEISQINRFS